MTYNITIGNKTIEITESGYHITYGKCIYGDIHRNNGIKFL